jgi:hypothetical protein
MVPKTDRSPPGRDDDKLLSRRREPLEFNGQTFGPCQAPESNRLWVQNRVN